MSTLGHQYDNSLVSNAFGFLRLPMNFQPYDSDADWVITGVPFDMATSGRAGGRHGHRHGDGERPGAGLRHDVLLPSGRGQPDRPVGVVGVLLGDDAVGSAFGVHRDRHSFTAGQRDAELERQPVDRLLRGAP